MREAVIHIGKGGGGEREQEAKGVVQHLVYTTMAVRTSLWSFSMMACDDEFRDELEQFLWSNCC